MAHVSDPVGALAVFEHQNDLVFGIDVHGTIVYVNQVTVETLGRSRDDLVDDNIANFVHPDDLERAAEFVASVQSERPSTDLRPAIYRVSHADGTWLPLEITGSRPVPTGPLAGWMLMIGRYPGDYRLHRQVTELLTSSAPITEVLQVLPDFGHWRHPTEPYAILYTGPDGEPAAVGSDEAAELCLRFGDPDTPWAHATTTGQTVVCIGHDELPSELREAAVDRGLLECMAVPVDAPDRSWSAVIVTWSTERGPNLFVHRYPIEQMSSALTLVMQWHQHIADLERAARFDSMTGLPNRSTFLRLLDRTDHREDIEVAVLYVDLDEFKMVNDQHGHAAGDAVLSEAARRMTDVIREGDVAARLGGDEFAVLCIDIGSVDQAVAVAERLLERMTSPVEVDGEVAVVSASIGIAVGPVGGGSAEMLLERADEAMYTAKRAGRNQWRLADA